MGFELTIAVKRHPLESGVSESERFGHTSYTAIAVNGTFGAQAARDVVQAISEASREGADSVLVDLANVEVGEDANLASFAADLMALRGSGVQVQLSARQPSLHATLSDLPESRDWLIAYSDDPPGGARRSLHLDGPDSSR